MTWPFREPPSTTVFTTSDILDRGMPIVFVTHDREDGRWRFQSVNAPLAAADARAVGLKTILALAPGIAELADLPPGWCARREGRDGAWKRERMRG